MQWEGSKAGTKQVKAASQAMQQLTLYQVKEDGAEPNQGSINKPISFLTVKELTEHTWCSVATQ